MVLKKATKIDKIFTIDVVSVKSTVKISSIFVAFLENTNFNNNIAKNCAAPARSSITIIVSKKGLCIYFCILWNAQIFSPSDVYHQIKKALSAGFINVSTNT